MNVFLFILDILRIVKILLGIYRISNLPEATVTAVSNRSRIFKIITIVRISSRCAECL